MVSFTRSRHNQLHFYDHFLNSFCNISPSPFVPAQNTTLTKNLADARHHIQQLETSGQRQADKVQMLEKLSATLEEEKKTLLTQLNKQLEKNQDLLVKTLETKDVALEDERIFK